MSEWLALLILWFLQAIGLWREPSAGESLGDNWRVCFEPGKSTYRGDFQLYRPGGVVRERVPGQVIIWAGLPAEVYLKNPPPELRRHPHGPCLQLCDSANGWFKLHWERPPRDFDATLAYVEQLLEESFR